jgi:hypothetical protein
MATIVDMWRAHLLDEELGILADAITVAIRSGIGMAVIEPACNFAARARASLHVGALSQCDALREQAEHALLAAKRRARQEAA